MLETYAIKSGAIIETATKPVVFVFTDPDQAEKTRLINEFGIDHHDLDSSLDPDELGRLELKSGGSSVFILKRPRNYSSDVDLLLFTVSSLGLFLSKNRLVIVAMDSLPLFESKLRHEIRNVQDVILKIVYGIISHFLGHLKVINMLSESLERKIIESMGNRYLLNMFTLEKSLVYFINGIGSNQLVIEKIRLSALRLGFTGPRRDILDDILIENQQCEKQTEIYSDILTGLMDARSSIVNNNLSVLMKRLTIISVIFMPMNVLAGIGGMSEFSGWTKHIPWWIAFPAFLLALVPVGFLTYWILKKSGLERRSKES